MSEVLSKLAEPFVRRDEGLVYDGDLVPEEAWALVRENPGVRLLDIRSQAEWELVGRIPGAIEVEYRTYPGWRLNQDFIALVRQKTRGAEALLLLCRSGARSREAAEVLAESGFKRVFNVLEGFEGDKDGRGQRLQGGWKARGLPWVHS
ncbi:rhodanese-like domain-containing protein [Azovibrio restrictus]|uniref:rhodanese-like domain-containing protein n=1 Tax=Azovibrio restrictus TaxID=146938 RepID=UPI0026ED6690|nr:rhodanese-like domain-containing protein [Azovibrio restrictus]MDD3484441.1 rhodanese-like domain-containing protein [Azovibrio restrictus]